MQTELKKRAACDSCHNSKSRCTTDPGHTSCQRCKRIKITCTYSPYSRMGRPRKDRRAKDGRDKKSLSTDKGIKPTRPAEIRQQGGQVNSSRGKLGHKRDRGTDPSLHEATPSEFASGPPESIDFNTYSMLDWSQLRDNSCPGSDFRSTTSQSSVTSFGEYEDLPWLESNDLDSMMPSFEDIALSPHLNMTDVHEQNVAPTLEQHSSNLLGPEPKGKSCLSAIHSPKRNVTMYNLQTLSQGQPVNGSKTKDFQYSNKNATEWADRELLKLQLSLQELGGDMLPSFTGTESLPAEWSTNCAPDLLKSTKVDEIFSATHSLINIMQSLFRLSSPRSNRNSPSTPLSQESRNWSEIRTCTELESPWPGTMTMLLIIACYARLLSIYEPLVLSLRRNMKTIARQEELITTSPTSFGVFSGVSTAPSALPAFKVGNFSLTASSDFNIRLLLHILLQMLKEVHDTVRTCIPPLELDGGYGRYWGNRTAFSNPTSQPSSSSYSSPMTSAAYQALKEVSEVEKRLMSLLQQGKGDEITF